jgi:hypothetical protein
MVFSAFSGSKLGSRTVYRALSARIAVKNALIDQVVHQLYDLTEERITVMEQDGYA